MDISDIAPLPYRQKLVAILIGLAMMLIILEWVRRRKLLEEYSWLWLLTGTLLIVIVAWYDLLIYMSKIIQSTSPTMTLFLSAILFCCC